MANRASTLALTTASLASAYVETIKLVAAPPPRNLRRFSGKVNSFLAANRSLTSPKFSALFADEVKTSTAPLPSPADLEPKFTDATNQAFVVGSQIVSFNDQVTAARREAAVNSCLLAQLHASQVQPNPGTVDELSEWHAAYLNVLTNIGWVLESGVTTHQSTADLGAKVNKALLDLITALIPGGAAITLVNKVIDSIEKLSNSDPLITLYSSRVVEQNVIEFGASLGSGSDSGFLINVVECAVTVTTNHQEVLFFTWDASRASVDGRRFDLSLSDNVYAAVAQQVTDKIKPYVQSYISELSI